MEAEHTKLSLTEVSQNILNTLREEFDLSLWGALDLALSSEDVTALFIDREGKDCNIDNDQTTVGSVVEIMTDNTPCPYTLKLEGLEKLPRILELGRSVVKTAVDEFHDITIHGFYANTGSPSFGWHTDPMNVIMVGVEGTKIVEIQAPGSDEVVRYDLEPDTCVIVPANYPHRITNEEASTMLSVGWYKTDAVV